jgi:hypothetical protein
MCSFTDGPGPSIGETEAVRGLFSGSKAELVLVRPAGKEKNMHILFLLLPAFVVLAIAAFR